MVSLNKIQKKIVLISFIFSNFIFSCCQSYHTNEKILLDNNIKIPELVRYLVENFEKAELQNLNCETSSIFGDSLYVVNHFLNNNIPYYINFSVNYNNTQCGRQLDNYIEQNNIYKISQNHEKKSIIDFYIHTNFYRKGVSKYLKLSCRVFNIFNEDKYYISVSNIYVDNDFRFNGVFLVPR